MDRQRSLRSRPTRRVLEVTDVVRAPGLADVPGEPGAKPVVNPRHWVEGLADVIRMSHAGAAAVPRTALSCEIGPQTRTLFLPPEMRTLQPHALRWLESFARHADFRLSVDRRRNRVSPLVERRDVNAPLVAQGVAELMRQTGLPGPLARLSMPHRLLADSPMIDLRRLIAMTAHAVPDAKQVVLLPNVPLVQLLHNDTRPIRGYACLLDTGTRPTLLSHFDSPSLRSIGYSTGRQYVVQLLLGGGTLNAPALWTPAPTLMRTEPRFRLFRAQRAEHDFGLIYTTLYYDLQQQRPSPWWLGARAGGIKKARASG